MSSNLKSLMIVGFALGLLPTPLIGAGKPKPTPTPTPTCPDCEIVYTRDGKGRTSQKDLMLMKKDGSSKTLLLAGASQLAHYAPGWAPDGEWIAFYTNGAPGNPVRVIRNDGTGLATVASRCGTAVTYPAWRPIGTGSAYWLVYQDERGADGACMVPPPCCTSPGRNLWAVEVNLGTPVLAGEPVCLTCDLNAQDVDFWLTGAWSRDGLHFLASQSRRSVYPVDFELYIFDVIPGAGSLSLGGGWLLAPEGFDMSLVRTTPTSWAHWSDSLIVKTNEPTGTRGLWRFDINLYSDPKHVESITPVTTGSTYNFWSVAQWSNDDSQLVDVVGNTGSASTDGIYVITLEPFSMKLIAPSGSNAVSNPDWKPAQ